jgi:hypothetical protein
MNEYYTNIGKINLGNLSKVSSFLENIIPNLSKLNQYDSGILINTNTNLDSGNDLICMKYGTIRFFYTIKGEVLKELFDDWISIQNWVNNKVGNTLNTYPMLSLGSSHIFKHQDKKRAASINMGLWNSNTSITCFWENEELVSHTRYEIGEAILADVTKTHSVIVNDYLDTINPRAILMWTAENSYRNIKQSLI